MWGSRGGQLRSCGVLGYRQSKWTLSVSRKVGGQEEYLCRPLTQQIPLTQILRPTTFGVWSHIKYFPYFHCREEKVQALDFDRSHFK